MCDLQPVSTACFYFSVMRKSDGFLGGLLPQSVRENGEGAANTLRCPCAPWKWSLGRDCCRLPTPSVCGGPAGRISQTFKRPLCLGSGGRREAPDRLGMTGGEGGTEKQMSLGSLLHHAHCIHPPVLPSCVSTFPERSPLRGAVI